MKQLGIFGLAMPEPYGDVAVSTPCYAQVTKGLARGWMSLAGAMGGHTVVAKLLLAHGTDEQKQRYLPRWRPVRCALDDGSHRAGGGSDMQALRITAHRDGDDYVVTGPRPGSRTPGGLSWSRCSCAPTRRHGCLTGA